MKLEGEQTLLRVFLTSTDKYSWWSTAADALITRAVRRGLVGETTLEGFLGLDAGGKVVEPGRWALVEHRPLVLEFFDSPRVIGGFLPDLVEVVRHGLATLERAHVLAYRRRAAEAAGFASHLVPGRPEPAAYLPSPEEFPIMLTAVDGQLLRIFVDDTDTFEGQPVYRAIVGKAHDLGMTNAVVLRAPMGFGTHRRVHTDRFPDYVTDLPVLVEVVGTAEEIARLLPFLDEAVPEGLVTIEGVKMLRLGPAEGRPRRE
jgi:PII-like signaling protein